MGKDRIETRAITNLTTNLFVRRELDQDRVLYLAELIENKVKLPPPWVTPDGRVIDGRHRIEAWILNDVEEIEVRIVEVADEAELIAMAFKANAGGSKPPTALDTEHTVTLLLERNMSGKQIAEILGLPPGLARKYVKNVQSRLARVKMQRAADSITEGGLTLAKAAEHHGVESGKLKEFISNKRRQKQGGISEMQRNLTKKYLALGVSNGHFFRGILEKFEDGDMTEKQANDIFSHVIDLQSRSSRSLNDWLSRLRAIKGNGSAKTN